MACYLDVQNFLIIIIILTKHDLALIPHQITSKPSSLKKKKGPVSW